MARIPTTSETLLRDLSGDSQHARWGELVTRYRPMLEAYMRERFPSVEADEAIASRLSNCAFGEARGTFVAGMVFGDWRITAFVLADRIRFPGCCNFRIRKDGLTPSRIEPTVI